MSQVQGDPELAAIFARTGYQPQPSRIIATDWLATAFNRERLGLRRIVDLSCHHKAATRNQSRMTCPRCAELLKHGFDYEGWLRRAVDSWPFDGLIWRDDPIRFFNEKTVGGIFVDDDLDDTRP